MYIYIWSINQSDQKVQDRELKVNEDSHLSLASEKESTFVCG